MDVGLVFSRLLQTLAASPMWQWGTPPSLWAVLSDDPVIIIPAFMVEDMPTLRQMAQHWMSEHPGNVPVDTLALVVEGSVANQTGHYDVRDCIVTRRDGGMSMVRFWKDNEVLSLLDPTDLNMLPIEVMREVGASAWP